MGNVLDPGKQQQVVGLGRLGWSLRRIEAATGIDVLLFPKEREYFLDMRGAT